MVEHPDRCPVCGHTRHSWPRWAIGRVCFELLMLVPTKWPHRLQLILIDALGGRAGDFIYDRRGWCDRTHGRAGKL